MVPRPGTRHRIDTATGLYTSTHGKSAHPVPPVPPQGHFQMDAQHFRTFHHDASSEWQDSNVPEHKKIYRGTEKMAEPAHPPEPGQVVVRDLARTSAHSIPASALLAPASTIAADSTVLWNAFSRGCLQGYRAHGSGIHAVRTRAPERHVNTQSTATHVIHDEEHTWKRYSHRSLESQDSTHNVVFNPPAQNTPQPGTSGKRAMGGTPDIHRVAVGAGPAKRAISPGQNRQKTTTLSVHDRIYLTDVVSSRTDAERHGSQRPF